MPSSLISQSKSKLLCGESVDLETLEVILQDNEFAEQFGDDEVLAEARSRRRMVQYMLQSSKPFRELEMLQTALGAMDDFATLVENFEM